MAELSADTKAILDRLKKEGSYIRNGSGGGDRNSLKAVKIELQKFGDTFNAIRESMGGMQAVTTQSAEFNKLRAQEEAEIAKLDEKDRDEYRKQQAENAKLSQKNETNRIKDEAKKRAEDKKKDIKIFGKDGIITNALKSSFNFVKTIALVGALGTIGYEFIAGMLEKLAPATFGPDGSIGQLPTAFEIFGKMGKALSSTNWDELATNLNFLASADFYQSLLSIAAVAGTGYVAAKGIGLGANLLTAASLAKLASGGADDAAAVSKAGKETGKGGLTRRMGLRFGVAGALFMAAEAIMPVFQNAVRTMGTDMKMTDIMNTPPTKSAQIPGNMATAGMAALFAPGGPFIKAIVGFATFGVLSIMDYLEEKKDADTYSNIMEGVLREESAQVQTAERHLRNLKKRAKYLDDGTLDAEILAAEEEIKRLKLEETNAAKKALQDSLDKQSQFQAEMEGEDLIGTIVGKHFRERFKDATGKSAKYATDEEKAKYGITREDLESEEGKALLAWHRQNVMYKYTDGGGDFNIDNVNSQIEAFVKRYPEFMSMVKKPENSLRAGTKGFRNFGNGTFAVLHGEEAVIPRASLEGQILEGLRSGGLPTKDNMTNLIASAMRQGGGVGGGATIINNVDNSAPVSIQQSKGGDRVANTRMYGGGGGGSYIDMPGLVV